MYVGNGNGTEKWKQYYFLKRKNYFWLFYASLLSLLSLLFYSISDQKRLTYLPVIPEAHIVGQPLVGRGKERPLVLQELPLYTVRQLLVLLPPLPHLHTKQTHQTHWRIYEQKFGIFLCPTSYIEDEVTEDSHTVLLKTWCCPVHKPFPPPWPPRGGGGGGGVTKVVRGW